MAINSGLFTSDKDYWETPNELFKKLDNRYHFTLDPCSSDTNAKCLKHYTKENSGLDKSWKNEIVFMNPPYGKEISKWVEKADQEYRGGGNYYCPSTRKDRYKVVSRLYLQENKDIFLKRACEV